MVPLADVCCLRRRNPFESSWSRFLVGGCCCHPCSILYVFFDRTLQLLLPEEKLVLCICQGLLLGLFLIMCPPGPAPSLRQPTVFCYPTLCAVISEPTLKRLGGGASARVNA